MILLLLACGAPSADTLPGLCEASALLWDGHQFLVGDNEVDDRLFTFDAQMRPTGTLPLSPRVEDIEALAFDAAGELIVVGSHSTNKKGQPQPERRLLLRRQGEAWGPVRPDLDARGVGLNIEGAALWRGSVWLGLRGPLAGDEAQLLRLSADLQRVEEARALPLGGMGVRELTVVGADLLILAGPVEDGGPAHVLWRLPVEGPPVRLGELPNRTEGLAAGPDGSLRYVVDGDGKKPPCAVPSTWGLRPAP